MSAQSQQSESPLVRYALIMPDSEMIKGQPTPTPTPIYLRVPYEEREAVKTLGARWNPRWRMWWIPSTADQAPFAAWIESREDRLRRYA